MIATSWLTERYTELDTVSREGVIQNFRGVDRASARPVLIRVVEGATLTAGVRLRLENHARAMDGLTSDDGVCPLLQQGVLESRCLQALACDEAEPLRARLDRGPLGVAETLQLARNLLKGLAALHQAGLVVRDLTPLTVMLGECARLAAFALTRYDVERPPVNDPAWCGALRYASPEQSGLLQRDVGPASDLYALGVILYECLAGTPPFNAGNVRSLLRMQAAGAMAPLSGEVPPLLNRIIGRLLQTDPRERYQGARAALADIAALQSGEALSGFVLGQSDARGHLADPQFIGREHELEALDAFLRSRDSRPQLALIEAPSGGGKSRLLDEFALRARTHNVALVSARCRRSEAQQPFHILTQILRAVVAEADLEPLARARLEEVIEDSQDVLWMVLPEWGSSERARVAEMSGEFRILTVARKLLEALGTPERPLLVLLDDCQWADHSTLRLLQMWSARDASPLRLVVAFRSEEVDGHHPLRHLPHRLRLVLPALSADQAHALAVSMGGHLPSAIQPLIDQAEGNPFRVTELMRGAQETGLLTYEDGAWHFHAHDVTYTTRTATMLVDRLELLESATLHTLQAAAVLGRSFDASLVYHLGGDNVVPALQEAQERSLIWHDAHGTRFTFVHDRIREALLEGLDDARRRKMHHAAAAYFEHNAPTACYERAYHLHCAGDVAAAFPHALTAARQALARFALEDAEQHFRIALLGAPDPADRSSVREGLGSVLSLRGRYEEGERLCLQALEACQGPFERARCHLRLAEIYSKIGRSHEAREQVFAGLRVVGHHPPGTRVTLFLDILRQIGVQTLHSLFSAHYLARRSLDHGEGDLMACDMYDSLKNAAIGMSDMPLLLWGHLRSLNTIERYPPTRQLGWVWIEHGEVLSIATLSLGRGKRYLEKGLALEETRSDRLQLARGFNRKACIEHNAGHLRTALEIGSRCLAEMAECVEDFWEVGAAQFYIARNQYLLGQTGAAAAMFRRVWLTLRGDGDPRIAFAALNDWARCRGGLIPAEELRDPERSPVSLARAELLMARAFQYLGSGRPRDAAEALEKAVQETRGQEPKEFYVHRLCWLATAWRLAASALPLGAGARRGDFLRRARRATGHAMAQAHKVPVRLPHLLRERAILAAEGGRENSARRLFADALRIAVQHENWVDFAWALYERGRIGTALGWDGAERNLVDATWAFRSIGLDPSPLDQHRIPTLLEETPPPSPGLMDRFLAVIEAGRAIVSCLSIEAVLAAVKNAAIELLRPQACTTHTSPATYRGNARSYLEISLTVQGRPQASVVVTHQVADYFQTEERMLAAYIAALGSAALETAESFASVASLSESLQQQSQRLQVSLDEKEVMLREIHHRVKNNLQVILSLLNLQASHCADPRLAGEFHEMTNRIRSMAMIHEFIYGEENLSEIRMDGYLKTLVEHLVIGHGTPRIEVRTTITPAVLPMAVAVDCGLLLNELVSNALQHAFPDERPGHIEVELSRRDGQLTLRVADDGIGFDDLNLETASSMGLTLVRLLRDKLGARVTYTGSQGTVVLVTLPQTSRLTV